jgi:hypothetical protein
MYQVCTTASDNVRVVDDTFVYADSAVKITYTLWATGGVLNYEITNTGPATLYFDWSKSYLMYNNARINYNSASAGASRVLPTIEPGPLPALIRPGETLAVNRIDLRRDFMQFDFDPNMQMLYKRFDSTDSPISISHHLVFSDQPQINHSIMLTNRFWLEELRIMNEADFQKLKGIRGVSHGFYTYKLAKEKISAKKTGLVVGGSVAVVGVGCLFGYLIITSAVDSFFNSLFD